MEIYIHIPFCAKKCAYCDFLSFPAGKRVQAQYVDSLLAEIREKAVQVRQGTDPPAVSSIFIGGGTPSILDANRIAEILDAVHTGFSVAADAEISIEANPGTVTPEKLHTYRDCGINRISFGLQSAQNAELAVLGRIHTFEKFEESFRAAREAGFSNINVDLMSAIPGQSETSWEDSLRKTAALGPEHISAYSLILEEGTPFYEKYRETEEKIEAGCPAEEIREEERGKGFSAAEMLPDEETERRMYERTAEILSPYGYQQYEISNYAKPGFACRHNIGYWTGIPYYGFGLGASSYLHETRFKNTDNLEQYLRKDFKKEEIERLDSDDRQAEFMILGLRMTKGISDQTFCEKFGCAPEDVYGAQIRKYEQVGLLQRKNGRIFLTREGISLSNVVMESFLP